MPKIQFRRGNKNGLPALSPGEPALTLDTSELFVGGKSGNLQVPVLGKDGKVPAAQLPAMDYIPTSQKGVAGGVATLDKTGKIPAGQIPAGDYFTKAQSLQAATAALFGLPASAVPDDVLAKIAILIDALETNSVKIATGSYVGTGSETSATLAFDFEPKLVIITESVSVPNQTMFISGSPYSRNNGYTSGGSSISLTWGGNSVSWSIGNGAGSASIIFNGSGTTYYYVAIG